MIKTSQNEKKKRSANEEKLAERKRRAKQGGRTLPAAPEMNHSESGSVRERKACACVSLLALTLTPPVYLPCLPPILPLFSFEHRHQSCCSSFCPALFTPSGFTLI